MTNAPLAEAIAGNFSSRWDAGYVRWKVRTDPIYAIVKSLLSPNGSLLDLGCGMGLLSLYLHACGDDRPIVGVDHDARKIRDGEAAVRAAGANMRFIFGDVRTAVEVRGDVVLLDVLHYFDDEDQRTILQNAARSTAVNARLMIRDCLRDGSLRYYATVVQERFSKTIGWLRGERLNFPPRERIVETATAAGLTLEEVRPLWFNTPFNNYLLVFRRQ